MIKLALFPTTTKADKAAVQMEQQTTAPNDAFVKNGSIVIQYGGNFYRVYWDAEGTKSERKASVSVNAIYRSDKDGNVPIKINHKWFNDDLLIEACHAAFAHVGKIHLPDYTLSQTIN